MGHLKALLKKNLTLWKRGGICTYCEIILPTLFCLFFVLMKSLSDQEKIGDQSYLQSNTQYDEYIPQQLTKEFDSSLSGSNIETILQQQIFQNCISHKISGELEQNGKVYLSPQGNDIVEVLADYMEGFGYEVEYHDSVDQLFDYIKSEDYKYDVCLGVTFDDMDLGNKYQYRLHYNTSAIDELQIPSYKNQEEYISYKFENIEDFVQPWIESGFVVLQNWIDNLIAEKENGSAYGIEPTVTSFKVPKHIKDDLPDIMVGNFATFTTLPLIIVFLRFLYQLVIEKETKIREQMRIMGLSDTSFYLSWLIQYAVVYFIISLLTTIISCLTIFSHSNFFLVLVWYFLYCLNCIVQALLISAFFSKAKIANIVGMVIYLGFYIITTLIGNNNGYSTGTRTALSIIPQVNLSLGGDVLVLIETKNAGMNWDNLDQKVNKYYLGISLLMFLASLVLQTLLFLYFDQVIPSEIGVKKHPLFCLGFKKSRKSHGKSDEDQKHEQKEENIEEVEQYLKQMEKEKNCVKISELEKIYPNGKKAVNNLSLTMYKDQIFCLLGHNGSGKSTTISMLTGMIPITEGEVEVFGNQVQGNLEEIRKIMGICPQHDILFDNLTVYEHLKLYAVIKGRNQDEEMEKEIQQLLNDVDLMFKKDALSKTLSGGQKRRLSVAMAFVGGSRVIYLDEPTSGCDTSVRRHIWDMLKKYKQDRIIVLTTHFMDEADYLGDRISIIGEGRLICTGSPNFLKNRFGVGYNLTIVKNDPTSTSEHIVNLIKKHIPNVAKPKIASAEIAFQLSMQEVQKFQQLFDELDQKKKQLDISNYGISITTMEQVFLEVSEKNSTSKDEEEDEMQAKINNSSLIQNNEIDNFNLNEVRIKNSYKLFMIHFWALIAKRLRYFKRDKKGLACEIILPCLLLIFGLLAVTSTSSYADPDYTLEAQMYDFTPISFYSGSSGVSKSDLDTLFDNYSSDYQLKYLSETNLNDWDQQVLDKKNEETLSAYYVDSYTSSGSNIQYILESNSLYRDALPLQLNQMNQAILKNISGNKELQLSVIIESFPMTNRLQSVIDSAGGIGVAFIFALIMSFIPSSLISYIIKERQDQVKHQQIVSGVSLKAYWLSNYFIDFVKFLCPVYVLALLLLFAYDVSQYTDEGEVFSAVALLLLLFGVAIIPFTYMFSFLFRQPGNGQVSIFFFNFLLGGLLPMIVWLFRVFFEDVKPVFDVLQWILRIVPTFSLGYGLLNLASRETYLMFFDDVKSLQSAYDIDIALGDMLMLVLVTVISCILIMVFEGMVSSGTLSKIMAKRAGYPQFQKTLLDDDVQREEDEVQRSKPEDYVIRLNKVRKVFKAIDGSYNPAVQQVSVGIKQGECFALLGINGAGKTTLFKILSGDHQATSGEAHINGHNVSTDMETARYDIGYCPQFDALLENLTTREHLELYAAIKGIPSHLREKLISQKIEEMNLKKFEHIPAGTYSGGNKRKLSVAVAMIGNPPVVLLDEPSTGMDPKARRFMWSVISKISTKRKSSSIILTTHSMEEAEALSTKMVVMVQGQFRCMGSIQHIKSKFGQGYEVEVKVKIPKEIQLKTKAQSVGLNLDYCISDLETLRKTMKLLGLEQFIEWVQEGGKANEIWIALNSVKGLYLQHLVEFFIIEEQSKLVQDYIAKNFSKYQIIEHYGSFTRYKIETNESTGKIFGAFENGKQNLGVIDSYSVRQATIEAIFNQFATNAIETADFNKGGKFYRSNTQQYQNNQYNQNTKSNKFEVYKDEDGKVNQENQPQRLNSSKQLRVAHKKQQFEDNQNKDYQNSQQKVGISTQQVKINTSDQSQ